MNIYGDLETFLLDNEDRIYRYWVKKQIFTPREMENKYIDQPVYIDDNATSALIVEVIPLPNGNILIGFQDLYDESSLSQEHPYISYHQLNEIQLDYWECDREKFIEEEEEE